eukprot:483193-Pelagomonas_calceolata.AAC.2
MEEIICCFSWWMPFQHATSVFVTNQASLILLAIRRLFGGRVSFANLPLIYGIYVPSRLECIRSQLIIIALYSLYISANELIIVGHNAP